MDRKWTLRDTNQIQTAEHHEEYDAKRVYIVNGEMPVINVPETKAQQIEKIEVPVVIVQKELQIEKIEVPVVTKEIEIKEIQTPVIVIQKEIQIEKIEVPVIQNEIKIIEVPVIQKEVELVEKPVIVKEYKDLPKWVNVLLVAQALTSIIMLLKK